MIYNNNNEEGNDVTKTTKALIIVMLITMTIRDNDNDNREILTIIVIMATMIFLVYLRTIPNIIDLSSGNTDTCHFIKKIIIITNCSSR